VRLWFYYLIRLIILDWLALGISKLLWQRADDEYQLPLDYVIGIGIGLRSDGTPSSMSQAVARKCGFLIAKNHAKKLILAGGAEENGITEAEAMERVAVEFGAHPSKIALETTSKNTHENAVNVLKIIKKERGEDETVRIGVVGFYLHVDRAVKCFKKVTPSNWQVYLINAYSGFDPQITQKRLKFAWFFLIWNTIAYLYFALKGWI